MTSLSDKLAQGAKVRSATHNDSEMHVFFNPAIFVTHTGNGKWVEDARGQVIVGEKQLRLVPLSFYQCGA